MKKMLIFATETTITMTLLKKKIQTSFSTQLSLMVAAFVLVTSGVVVFLLVSFSKDFIRQERIDTTMQALENLALRIDNTLRQEEMTARLEKQQFRIGRQHIDQLIEANGSEESLRQSLPNAQLFITRRDSSRLDAYISGAESGYREMLYDDDKEVYVFTQPVGNRSYCLTAVCPVEDINNFSRVYRVLTIWSIGGLLVLLLILYFIIAYHLRPLHRLADAAQSIAGGNLDTQIPDTYQEHEAGRLQSSLKKMQQSLRTYIDEMQQKQATLSEHNAELQAAYDQAKAYEQKKAKFLHDMTERMAAPVDKVYTCTDTICNDYGKLSQADVEKLEASIMDGANEITELLDQLIKEPADA